MVDFCFCFCSIEKISGKNLKCQIKLPKYVDLNIVQSFESSYFQNAHWHLKISLNLHYLFNLSLFCIWLPLWGFRVPFILIVVDGNDDNILSDSPFTSSSSLSLSSLSSSLYVAHLVFFRYA